MCRWPAAEGAHGLGSRAGGSLNLSMDCPGLLSVDCPGLLPFCHSLLVFLPFCPSPNLTLAAARWPWLGLGSVARAAEGSRADLRRQQWDMAHWVWSPASNSAVPLYQGVEGACSLVLPSRSAAAAAETPSCALAVLLSRRKTTVAMEMMTMTMRVLTDSLLSDAVSNCNMRLLLPSSPPQPTD